MLFFFSFLDIDSVKHQTSPYFKLIEKLVSGYYCGLNSYISRITTDIIKICMYVLHEKCPRMTVITTFKPTHLTLLFLWSNTDANRTFFRCDF